MPGASCAALAAIALGLEAAAGYPAALYRVARHPVVWIGTLIGVLDRGLNRVAGRRAAGVVALAIVLLAAVAPAALMQWLLWRTPAWPLLGVLAASLPAARGLHRHVRAVGRALDRDGLDAGRRAVAHIVGRDPASLDAPGVARAAIESLAENFSDGVVAPAFWCLVAGLPGIAGYKAVNTADSMIGHLNARYARFGWAAARLDDAVNLPASRLSAAWLIAAAALTPGGDARAAVRSVLRDARHHRSPNAGWPEAAVAGALGLRLGGPRVYGGARIDDAWMGDGCADAGPADIARACALYRRACALQLAVVVLLAIATTWA